MRVAVVLVGLLTALNVGRGQWIEQTIQLAGATRASVLAVNQAQDIVYAAGSGPNLLLIDGTGSRLLAQTRLAGPPRDLAYAANGNKLYCPNGTGISVCDGTSGAELRRIPLPSTAGPAIYFPAAHKLYAAAQGCCSLFVVNCSTDAVARRIAVAGAPDRFCLDSTGGRVYVAMGSAGVAAVNAGSGVVVGRIQVSGVSAITYDAAARKVYCAARNPYSVCVIDCRTIQAVAWLPVSGEVCDLVCSSVSNRVYATRAARDSVVVIDGAGDSIRGRVAVGEYPTGLAYDPANNRIYCADYGGNTLTVIDCLTDMVIRTIPVRYCPRWLLSAPGRERVYCAEEEDICVVDTRTMTVIRFVDTYVRPLALCHNPLNDKLYCGSEWRADLLVLDGATGAEVGRVQVGNENRALVCDSTSNRVYCANGQDSTVSVVDGAGDSLLTTLLTGAGPVALCHSIAAGKVYCANAGSNSVTVIDGATSTVRTTIAVGRMPLRLACARTSNKVYCSNLTDGTVSVIDGLRDIVVATVPVPRYPLDLYWGPERNVVYCACQYDTVVAIDCAGDSIVATIPVGRGAGPFAANPLNDRVYCADFADGTVTVIDERSDTVIATIDGLVSPVDVACFATSGKALCADEGGTVWGIHGWVDRVLSEFECGATLTALASHSGRSRIYCADNGSSSITVFGDSSIDVAAVSVVEPQYCAQHDTVTPVGSWRNCGNAAADFQAWMLLDDPDGSRVYASSVFVTGLAPAAETVVGCFAPMVMGLPGRWTARCSTAMPGDGWQGNDTVSRAVNVGRNYYPGWYELASMPEGPSGRGVSYGGWLVGHEANRTVYGAKGNKTNDFYSYDLRGDQWSLLNCMPYDTHPLWHKRPPRKGAKGCYGGHGHIFATQGNNTLGFWRYDIATDGWQMLPDVPAGASEKKVKGGTDMVHVARSDGREFIYLLKGYRCEFYRFDTGGEFWQALPDAPAGSKNKWPRGSWLVHDPDSGLIYAHKAKYHELWVHDLDRNAWRSSPLTPMPLVGQSGRRRKSKDGGSAVMVDRRILALKGGNTQELWAYYPAGDSWRELDTVPLFGSTRRKKKVKHGADLIYCDGMYLALKGNKTREFWRYVPWPAAGRVPPRSGVAAGRAEPTWIGLRATSNPSRAGRMIIRCSLPQAGPVEVTVQDATGRVVRHLVRGWVEAGVHQIEWLEAGPGRPTTGSGVYFVRLDAPGVAEVQKILVLR